MGVFFFETGKGHWPIARQCDVCNMMVTGRRILSLKYNIKKIKESDIIGSRNISETCEKFALTFRIQVKTNIKKITCHLKTKK